jgi:hypothetical protein
MVALFFKKICYFNKLQSGFRKVQRVAAETKTSKAIGSLQTAQIKKVN